MTTAPTCTTLGHVYPPGPLGRVDPGTPCRCGKRVWNQDGLEREAMEAQGVQWVPMWNRGGHHEG